MTDHKPAHPAPDPRASLNHLANQVDELRRRVDDLDPLSGQVDELGRLVGRLTDTVAAVAARRRPAPAPSWLVAPADEDAVRDRLDELCAWLAAVYLRYPDGEQVLPLCWMWHPDVVEELLWLMHAWCAAYQGADASVAAAGEWHDRQRPGVVNRLRKSVGSCSLERHQTREGWPDPPGGAIAVPGIEAAGPLAAWWALRRDQVAPEPIPTADGLAGVRG